MINLTTQEILKFIKSGEAQDENTILEEISEGFIDIIPKLKKLIIKFDLLCNDVPDFHDNVKSTIMNH